MVTKQTHDAKEDSTVSTPEKQYVDVSVFIASVASKYKMDNMQRAGFSALMKSLGKEKMLGIEAFLPYLRTYLNIERK